MLTLDQLPLEVLQCIIQYFYPPRAAPTSLGAVIDANYVHPVDDEPTLRHNHPRKHVRSMVPLSLSLHANGRTTMQALGKTNRKLHDLTRPFIYRSIVLKKPLRLDHLLKTLYAHPIYFSYIQQIIMHDVSSNCQMSSEWAKECHEEFDKYDIVDSEGARIAFQKEYDYTGTDAPKLLPLLLVHCNNLQYLALDLGRLKDANCVVRNAPELANLTTLKLTGFLGRDSHISVPPSYQWILDASPNLHTLEGYEVVGFDKLSHPGLSMIKAFYTPWTEEEFTQTLSNFPKLSAFYYMAVKADDYWQDDDIRPLTPQQLVSVLNRLGIYLDYLFIRPCDEDDLESDTMSQPSLSLKGLRVKALELETFSYVKLRNESYPDFYRRIYPKDIKALIVGYTSADEDLRVLVETLQDHAPNLEEIFFAVRRGYKMSNIKYPKFDSGPARIKCRFYCFEDEATSYAPWVACVPRSPVRDW